MNEQSNERTSKQEIVNNEQTNESITNKRTSNVNELEQSRIQRRTNKGKNDLMNERIKNKRMNGVVCYKFQRYTDFFSIKFLALL